MRSTRGMLLAATLLAATATTAAAGEPEWIRQFGTSARDVGSAVAVGPDGRVHVVGNTYGRFFGGTNKGHEDVFITTFDRDGRELWRRQPGTTGDERARGAATDADGNVYVVGKTYGALGGIKKGDYFDDDAFVIKFDRDGRYLWKRQPGTTGSEDATAVATDVDGNVYMVGHTLGALGGAYKDYQDAFVIKFDRDGHYLWKRQPGTTGYEYAAAVATDADGNVYVVGDTEGAIGGANKGYQDAFVIKFDRDGRYLWKRQPGTTRNDGAYGVATDADGNVYVVGFTDGSLPGYVNLGYYDVFVIKYDRDGRIVWRDQTGTSNNDYAQGVAMDADGNVYVVGFTDGSLPGNTHLGGEYDALMIKYDRDGRIVWRDQSGTTDLDLAVGVATDADGNAYVVGHLRGSLPGYVNLGENDVFVIKYGADAPQ